MIEILAIIAPVVGSIIVAVISAYSNRKIKEIDDKISKNNQNEELKDMVLGIGQATLIAECRRYVSEETISKDDFEALRDHLYKPYKALGGNSTGDLWFGRVETMYAKELK